MRSNASTMGKGGHHNIKLQLTRLLDAIVIGITLIQMASTVPRRAREAIREVMSATFSRCK